MKLFTKLSFASLLLAGSPFAYSGTDDYVVMQYHVDHVNGSKTILDIVGECFGNSTCRAALGVFGDSFGIPASQALGVVAKVLPAAPPTSEGTYINLQLPDGYQYCRVTSRTISIVPRDGDRASTYVSRADRRSLYFETWTPRLSVGEGRSWVDAVITLVGVKDHLASSARSSGTCYEGSGRHIWACKGRACETTFKDSGQNVL